MSRTHPSRGRREAALLPSAPEIRAARDALGITQAEAASRALVSTRAWIKWESGERPISGSAWALFRLRSRLATLRQIEAEAEQVAEQPPSPDRPVAARDCSRRG